MLREPNIAKLKFKFMLARAGSAQGISLLVWPVAITSLGWGDGRKGLRVAGHGRSLLKYSQRFHIYTTTTAMDVWARRVCVWRLMKSMGVEATACMGKILAAAEMFLEHSGIALKCAEGLGLRLARRWNK